MRACERPSQSLRAGGILFTVSACLRARARREAGTRALRPLRPSPSARRPNTPSKGASNPVWVHNGVYILGWSCSHCPSNCKRPSCMQRNPSAFCLSRLSHTVSTRDLSLSSRPVTPGSVVCPSTGRQPASRSAARAPGRARWRGSRRQGGGGAPSRTRERAGGSVTPPKSSQCPLTRWRRAPSAEMATLLTEFVWLSRVRRQAPVSASHTLVSMSSDRVTTREPSADIATHCTSSACSSSSVRR